jgi:hypothetical protein
MTVSSFGNQKGLIVCMDDSGMLTISYLGKGALRTTPILCCLLDVLLVR